MADRVRGMPQDKAGIAAQLANRSPSPIQRGTKVVVFQDPITKVNLEGNAVVIKVLRHEPWTDVDGKPIVRCNVKFDGAEGVYSRDVSSLANG